MEKKIARSDRYPHRERTQFPMQIPFYTLVTRIEKSPFQSDRNGDLKDRENKFRPFPLTARDITTIVTK